MARILLADDSITIQKVVEVILSKEGHELKIAHTGEDALTALTSFRPEIVLADIVMPGINGYQLAEEIRRNPETSSIPVILLAGAFEPIDQERAKNSGASDSLIKPFESEDLLNKINSLLLTGGAEPEEALEAEALEEAVLEEEPLEETALTEEALEEAVLAEEPLEVEGEEGLLELEDLQEEPIDLAERIEEEALAEAVMEGPEESLVAEPAIEALEAESFQEPELAEAVAPEPAAAPAGGISSEAMEGTVSSKVEEMINNVNLTEILKTTLDEKLADIIKNTDLTELMKGAIEEKLAEVLNPGILNEIVIDAIKASVRSAVEQSLSGNTAELVEKLLREQLGEALGSVSKVIENVVWETVPDISEAIIKKEIESLRSES